MNQYHQHFNAVGEQIAPDFRVTDLIIFALVLGVVFSLITGVLT